MTTRIKTIDMHQYSARSLCSRIRNQFGPVVTVRDLGRLLGAWPKPLVAMRRLELAKLAEKKTSGGKVVYTLAGPVQKPVGAGVKFYHKVAVVFVLGQYPLKARSTNIPRPGKSALVKVGRRVESVTFRGQVAGGWLVELAG